MGGKKIRAKTGKRKYKRATLKKAIKSVLSTTSETKYTYTFSSSTTIDQTGVQWPLSTSISQGVTSTDRIGAKITFLYMDLRVRFARNSTTPNDGIIRLIVYLYKSKSSASVPTTGQLLKQVGTIYGPLSAYDHKVVGDEIRVLYDSLFTVTSGNANLKTIKRRIKLNNIIQELDTTGYGTNTIYLYALSDNSTNPLVMHWYCRIAFKDI